MKNLKILMVALALLALPAVAFGQVKVTYDCEDCTHHASVFMGEGGLVATFDSAKNPKATKVSWIADCDGVKQWGELTPNDDGMVAMVFNMANGYACNADDGDFQIGPIMDGGWFWVTDDMNSAVGSLVNDDILKNATTSITSAGSGVTMTDGKKGAVYLKETATGRVGILPNILPEPWTSPTPKCGFTGSFTAKSPGKPFKASCTLGDGKAQVIATSTNGITGTTVRVADGDSVTRPAGGGSVSIVMDVWGNGTGHYVAQHATANNGITAGRGHAGLVGTAARATTRLTGISYVVKIGDTTLTDGGDAVAGVTYTVASNAATFSVSEDDAYCSKDNNKKATVSVDANVGVTERDQVVPQLVENHDSNADGDLDVVADADRVHRAVTSFDVVCPAGSGSSPSHEGVELIPENPFPTDR